MVLELDIPMQKCEPWHIPHIINKSELEMDQRSKCKREKPHRV